MAGFEPVDATSARRWVTVPGDWRRPGAAGGFTAWWDDRRAYGQVLPRPEPGDVPGFYEVSSYYTHASRGSADDKPGGFWHRLLVHLAWRADRGVESDAGYWARLLPAPCRVLEIGCGNGATLSILKAQGHEVVGVEPDPAARAEARAAGHTVHAGTAEDLPGAVTGQSYDVVIFMHVLEHCLDPAAAVRSARGLLAEGGRIVAEVPNNGCRGAQMFGPTWYWLDIPRHLNFFTRNSLEALFSSAGCRIDRTEFRGYVRQFLPSWAAAQAEIAGAFGMKPAGMARYWNCLLRTVAAGPERKYDSVRVVVRKGE